ncbi:putative signal peptide protein, partial [Puccinia sorghi]
MAIAIALLFAFLKPKLYIFKPSSFELDTLGWSYDRTPENQSTSCLINNWDRFKQQLFTFFRDPNEVRNAEFKIDWNNASFALHFQKGLPSRITDQLSLTGQRLKTHQQLINQTIKLDNCYHKKICSKKKANSTPSNSKKKDASKYKKKFPSKPFTPSALNLAPRSRKPTKIAL